MEQYRMRNWLYICVCVCVDSSLQVVHSNIENHYTNLVPRRISSIDLNLINFKAPYYGNSILKPTNTKNKENN